MSRDLTDEERSTFRRIYGVGERCESCGNDDPAIRIWEGYGSSAKEAGGDIGPDGIVAAVIICAACGHGQTIPREQLLGAKAA